MSHATNVTDELNAIQLELFGLSGVAGHLWDHGGEAQEDPVMYLLDMRLHALAERVRALMDDLLAQHEQTRRSGLSLAPHLKEVP